MQRRPTKKGLGKPKVVKIASTDLPAVPDEDRTTLATLLGAKRRDPYAWDGYATADRQPATFLIAPALADVLLPALARAGRLWRKTAPPAATIEPLAWDDGAPWTCRVRVGERDETYTVEAELRRANSTVPLDPSSLVDVVTDRLVVHEGRLARVEGHAGSPVVHELGQRGPIDIPKADAAYQREGLGWFAFLERFGFGGCLADDMGLGKTIMVLALLAARRAVKDNAGADRRPSLVVVPRSLIGNWQAESARFTPELRVLDCSHAQRTVTRDVLDAHDVVLVTYGTLRRDIGTIATFDFDYVILDEAQAVKNAGTVGAKAVRLLRARHRLALSGTPVENHLGELWSLFEFLNPGVLGRSSVFQRAIARPEAQAIDRAQRIGQSREVFAYRIIAKDTVEEKILQLQQSKRDLADAVLSADAVGLRHLEREDLELLLS